MPLCEDCSRKDPENLLLEDEWTMEYAHLILYEKIKFSNLACIPSIYYKYIKEYGWELNDIIDLYGFLKESEETEKITFKTKCPSCNLNFGLGWSTPIKLSCSGRNHAICLQCFSHLQSNLRCPLDNIERDASNPILLEVDNALNYPQCKNCGELLIKNIKIPIKSKCIHIICNECVWCPTCKDKVVKDKNAIDKSINKRLEFLETYCQEHNEAALKFKKDHWEISLLGIEINTFPRVYCKSCKKGPHNIKDHFKVLDSAIRETYTYLCSKLPTLDENYQDYVDEALRNLPIITYNQRLNKINEIAKLLEDLSQSENFSIKEERILVRFDALYPLPEKEAVGWKVHENQVESIIISCSLNIELKGLILGGDIYGNVAHPNIYFSCSETIVIDAQCLLGTFTIQNREEHIRFANALELEAGKKYTLSVIYDIVGGILYNGIPSKRKCKLECRNAKIIVESPKEYGQYRCYRNDLGGPIIGFILII